MSLTVVKLSRSCPILRVFPLCLICRPSLLCLLLASALASHSAHAAVDPIAIGSLTQVADLPGLTGLLENGVDRGNTLVGVGSGPAWAGGNTFLALPGRSLKAADWTATGGVAADQSSTYAGR